MLIDRHKRELEFHYKLKTTHSLRKQFIPTLTKLRWKEGIDYVVTAEDHPNQYTLRFKEEQKLFIATLMV